MRYTRIWSWFLLTLLTLSMTGIAKAQNKGAYTGTWKLTVLLGGSELDLALIKIEDKGGVRKGEIVAVNERVFPPEMKIPKVEAKAGRIVLTLSAGTGRELEVVGFGDAKEAKFLKAIVRIRGEMDFARLLKTTDTKIDAEKSIRELPERAKFQKVQKTEKAEDRAKLLKALVMDKATSDATVTLAGTALIKDQVSQEKPDVKLIEETIARIHSVAKPYGAGMQAQQLANVLDALTRSDKVIALAKKNAEAGDAILKQIPDALVKAEYYSKVAVICLRQKETAKLAVKFAMSAREALGDKAPVGEKVDVTELVIEALEKAGDAEGVKKEKATLATLEKELDADFLKNNVPFEPAKFKGRRGKSKRVAVVELFTGAQCPPCVAADVAFDALVESYLPKDVVFLQYHLHIPLPDPLTTEEGDARSSYYGVRGTPTYFLNGGTAPQMGGSRLAAKRGYDAMRKAIDEALEAKTTVELEASAKRKDNTVEIKTSVSGVETPSEKIRLRIVLLEDVVRYPGRNGQRYHHHVIRDMVDGADGTAVTKKSITKTARIDLDAVRKELNKYLDEYGKVRPFPDSNRPMKFEKLKVVAFVQNDTTKEILNAVQVDVE